MAVEKSLYPSVIRTSVYRVKEFKYSKNQNFPSISKKMIKQIGLIFSEFIWWAAIGKICNRIFYLALFIITYAIRLTPNLPNPRIRTLICRIPNVQMDVCPKTISRMDNFPKDRFPNTNFLINRKIPNLGIRAKAGPETFFFNRMNIDYTNVS